MPMNFEELDTTTRGYMLAEFEAEEAGDNPYRSKSLSPAGRTAFPNLLREAITSGDEQTLIVSLLNPGYWNPTERYLRSGVWRDRQLNMHQAAERLCMTEFNTWYVRGLAKRLLNEGVTHCQVYRAALPKWEPAECSAHEGQILSVDKVYRIHRARYWPEPGDLTALSIPFGPGCHHTIRRVSIVDPEN